MCRFREKWVRIRGFSLLSAVFCRLAWGYRACRVKAGGAGLAANACGLALTGHARLDGGGGKISLPLEESGFLAPAAAQGAVPLRHLRQLWLVS